MPELTDGLLRLVEDPRLRRRPGWAAAQARRARLWPHIVEQTRRVYEEAVRHVADRADGLAA